MEDLLSPLNGQVFRRIFADSENSGIDYICLQGFLKSILNIDLIIESVVDVNPSFSWPKPSDVRYCVLKVKIKEVKTGLSYVVDVKMVSRYLFKQRDLFYGSYLCSENLNVKEYSCLGPDHVIVICDFFVFKNSPKNKWYSQLKIKEVDVDYSRSLTVHFLELPKFQEKCLPSTILEGWMGFFCDSSVQMQQNSRKIDLSLDQACSILEKLSNNPKEKEKILLGNSINRDGFPVIAGRIWPGEDYSRIEALRSLVELAKEDGKIDGRAEMQRMYAFNMIKKGFSIEMISSVMLLDESVVLELVSIAKDEEFKYGKVK